MNILRRLLERRLDRDGTAPALEVEAVAATAGDRDNNRRERTFGVPFDILEQSLSAKVLDGWLQNQHQILVPLTFRLGRFESSTLDTLMHLAATVILNGSAADARAIQVAERRLRDAGAGEKGLATLHAALAQPVPLDRLLATARTQGLSPYAYAVSVAVADGRDPAGRLFANYVAARLDLSADTIRSIDRRFRR